MKKKKKPQGSAKKSAAKLWQFKDFLSMREIGAAEIDMLLKLAEKMKKAPEAFYGKLRGHSLVMLFQKPSMRTRVSFEVGMQQLGGAAVYMAPQEHPLGE